MWRKHKNERERSRSEPEQMAKGELTNEGGGLELGETENPMVVPPSLQQFLEDEGVPELLDWLVGVGLVTVVDLEVLTAADFEQRGVNPLKARSLVKKVQKWTEG